MTDLTDAVARFHEMRAKSRERRALLHDFVGINGSGLRRSNRPQFNPATALGEQDPDFNRGLIGYAEKDPVSFAKGTALAIPAGAADFAGIAQMGGNALANSGALSGFGISNLRKNPFGEPISGDPIRRFFGLDPDNEQGLAGEIVSPVGTMAKVLGIGVKSVVAGAKLAAGTGFDPSLAMTLFHGTPFKFNKFNLDKIGTGEGVQAYGHGLYFAENPGVASNYKNALGAGLEAADGTKLLPGNPEWTMVHRELLNADGDFDKARKALSDAPAEAIQELDSLRSQGIKVTKGHLYEVDIPDEITNRMLDWDAPLSEQPKAVHDLIANNPEFAKRVRMATGSFGELKGEQLYEVAAQLPSGGMSSDKVAGSALLNEAGIPGIRFFDQMSRGTRNGWSVVWDNGKKSSDVFDSKDMAKDLAESFKDDFGGGYKLVFDKGEGTRNIVVFNPDDIRQVKRDGEVVFERAKPKQGGLLLERAARAGAALPSPRESGLVSTRLPTGKTATENPLDEMLLVGLDAAKANPVTFEKNVALIRDYPNFRADNGGSADEVAEQFITHAEDNLLWLFNEMPAEVRERASKWYDGAHLIATELADKHGISSQQTAGVMAVLSPQKDWFQNVSLAERVLSIHQGQRGFKFSQPMLDAFVERPALEVYRPIVEAMKGRSMEDMSNAEAALFVRLYDEAFNSRSFEIITPEGARVGPKRTNAGAEQRVAWGSLSEIGKAVNILRDGSLDTISTSLGDQHKVRNFYNNIFDPSDPNHVTIDTHAVAASLFRPLSGNSLEVGHNLGGTGSSKNAVNGSVGTYPLFAEAYRRAADRAGVLPRQMQSVTWEAIRGLYTDVQKRDKRLLVDIGRTWENYRTGKITLEEAREQSAVIAGGIRPPEWVGK